MEKVCHVTECSTTASHTTTQQSVALLGVYRHTTWDGVGRQLASSQHDVSEVERAVVDVAQLHSRAAAHKVAKRGRDPAQRRQVAACQHVDVSGFGRRFIYI